MKFGGEAHSRSLVDGGRISNDGASSLLALVVSVGIAMRKCEEVKITRGAMTNGKTCASTNQSQFWPFDGKPVDNSQYSIQPDFRPEVNQFLTFRRR